VCLILLLISRNQLQVVGGCDVIVPLQFCFHPVRELGHRLMHGHEDTGNFRLDLWSRQRNDKLWQPRF